VITLAGIAVLEKHPLADATYNRTIFEFTAALAPLCQPVAIAEVASVIIQWSCELLSTDRAAWFFHPATGRDRQIGAIRS
jgi:hypothetical protein